MKKTFCHTLPVVCSLLLCIGCNRFGFDEGDASVTIEECPPPAEDPQPPQERPWWPGWGSRQRLQLTNNSNMVLGAGTTVEVSQNTRSLVDAGILRSDCGDLRTLYQPNDSQTLSLPVSLLFPPGANCATSEATRVHFSLQAPLEVSQDSLDYYIYTGNVQATSPGNGRSAFDIGSIKALLVCPFQGDIACVQNQMPAIQAGPFRFSGAQSALAIDGYRATVRVLNWMPPCIPPALTLEAWIYVVSFDGYSGNGYEIMEDECCSNYSIYMGGEGSVIGWFGGQATPALDQSERLGPLAWHHLALVRESQSLRLYIDGREKTRILLADKLTAPHANLAIGGRGERNQVWPGLIDEVRVSTTARYNSDFALNGAPLAADDATALLYHFDENGSDPRFAGKAVDSSPNANHGILTTGAQTATGLLGVEGGPQAPRSKAYGQGYAAHSGLLLETETTNRVPNPSFEHATDYSYGWRTVGSLVLEPNEKLAYSRFGLHSVKATSPSSDANQLVLDSGGQTAGRYSFSVFVYNVSPSALAAPVDDKVLQLVWKGDVLAEGVRYQSAGGGWWRVSYTGDVDAGPQTFGFQVANDRAVYIDGVQFENKSYPTSYTEGSFGTGYSWLGETNASASYRAANELTYTVSGIQAEQGAVSVWLLPDFQWNGADHLDSEQYCILSFGAAACVQPSISLRWVKQNDGSAPRVMGSYGLSATPVEPGAPEDALRGREWQHLVLTWNSAGSVVLFVNGVAVQALPAQGVTEGLGTTLFVGSRWRGLLSDLRLYDRELSVLQVESLYQASMVSQRQVSPLESMP